MQPAAVTFDCWNTLLREESWAVAHALRVDALVRACEELGVERARDEVHRAFDEAWSRHMQMWERGFASGAVEVARWALAELELAPRGPAVEHLIATFEEASHSSRVGAIEGAAETLEQLARDGVRIGLICDTGLTPGRVVRQHLEREGLLPWIGVTIFSDEWSRTKPDPALFRAALWDLAAPPEQSLHVGDLRRTDVAGARSVGMHSVRIRVAHDDLSGHAEADHVVASYAELQRLIEQLGER
jgi:putative hydrolase of the HAD superfamily